MEGDARPLYGVMTLRERDPAPQIAGDRDRGAEEEVVSGDAARLGVVADRLEEELRGPGKSLPGGPHRQTIAPRPASPPPFPTPKSCHGHPPRGGSRRGSSAIKRDKPASLATRRSEGAQVRAPARDLRVRQRGARTRRYFE